MRPGSTPTVMAMTTKPKLGKRQLGLLDSLANSHGVRARGIWHPGCGWHYGGIGATMQLCKGLLSRGYLEHDRDAAKTSGHPLATCFKLTSEGEELIAALKAEGRIR